MLDIDDFDRRILGELQRDATLTTQDLADRVGLSPSPCWRRVRRMQETGMIRAQVVLLDPRALGLDAMAHIHVSLLDHTEATIARFDDFVQRSDQVLECASITGSDDYVLKVVAQGPEDLERFLMRDLLALGVVRSSTTHFVLRQTKATTALPLR
ncbi:MAG: Lrp/AsnC family transcriptional regulator [Gemmobacter sp.]|nr:Lrp/AsnC family transcriptional regulator [Gemmobacter sp.]